MGGRSYLSEMSPKIILKWNSFVKCVSTVEDENKVENDVETETEVEVEN